MDRLQYVLDRLPEFYDKNTIDSKIRAVVNGFTGEYDLFDNQMDAVNNMIGIDTTGGTDLDRRWGKLLSIPRSPGEYDNIYRNRIKTSISDLSGGTQHALTYTVAVVLGINNDSLETARRIQVIDAWLYTGTEPINKSKGYAVCVIDLDASTFEYMDSINDIIQERINNTKASGTNIQLIFKNYRIMTYNQMSTSTYMQLATFRYNQLGDTI